MSVKMTIDEFKTSALTEVRRAASCGDSPGVVAGTEKLKLAEGLLRRYLELERDVDAVRQAFASPTSPKNGLTLQHNNPMAEERNDVPRSGRTRREHGRTARMLFAKWLASRGICIEQERGSRWRTSSGSIVGIASAVELESRPGKWFLGLPDENYKVVVLLCETRDGKKLHFVLPEAFYSSCRKYLSESSGQLKFNLLKSANHFYMVVPGKGRIAIDGYIDHERAFTEP